MFVKDISFKKTFWLILLQLHAERGDRQSYRDVEIDDPSLLVVRDEGRLHPHVGDVNRAREEEENSQAWQQQAEDNGYGDVELSARRGNREVRPPRAADDLRVSPSLTCHHANQPESPSADLRPAWPEPLVAVWNQSHQLVLLTCWNETRYRFLNLPKWCSCSTLTHLKLRHI